MKLTVMLALSLSACAAVPCQRLADRLRSEGMVVEGCRRKFYGDTGEWADVCLVRSADGRTRAVFREACPR